MKEQRFCGRCYAASIHEDMMEERVDEWMGRWMMDERMNNMDMMDVRMKNINGWIGVV